MLRRGSEKTTGGWEDVEEKGGVAENSRRMDAGQRDKNTGQQRRRRWDGKNKTRQRRRHGKERQGKEIGGYDIWGRKKGKRGRSR